MEMKFLQRVLREHIRNDRIQQQCRENSTENIITNYRQRCISHADRMEEKRIARIVWD